ncbi:twin-arginine translocation pathway signal [Sphingobacteriaceae bacterium]|nr:twin-arginine translocation pathway signal [Sphingobacteriaceae bacterium]
MDRRNFIKTSSLASGYFMIPGFLKPLERLFSDTSQKKLIVIQLSGGNDWLNTVIPYKNDLYYQKRTKIGLKQENLITLDKHQALNNSLASLKEFYDNGEMAIVNNVGYPNPDRSHFRSMDIWQTASASNEILQTGWLGRYMDNECKYPYDGIEADNYLSLAMKGKRLNGLAIKDIKQLYRELKTPYFDDISSATKSELLTENNQGYLYKTLLDTQSSVNYIYEKNKIFTNSYEYPNTALGKQLKDIAGFIGSGITTKVYYVSMSGFDTHVNQVDRQNNLLKQYSEAVTAFIKNLKDLGKWDDSLIFTFSEFGRRVEENASGGTDHGSAGNVFLFGKKLKNNGIVNSAPDLENLDEGDLRYSVDFRSIYKNILKDWLNADAEKLISGSVKNFKVV